MVGELQYWGQQLAVAAFYPPSAVQGAPAGYTASGKPPENFQIRLSSHWYNLFFETTNVPGDVPSPILIAVRDFPAEQCVFSIDR